MWLEHAKDIAESIALVCGGFFFAYKAYTGYLRNNLSLSVQCKRQSSSDPRSSYLVTCLQLKKGANGSLTLHDAQARVTYDETILLLSFSGIERSDTKVERFRSAERHQLNWSSINSKSPLLKLVPGEETELSVVCKVPADAVCTVEVAVLGQRTNGRPFGQWKASGVSLPETSV